MLQRSMAVATVGLLAVVASCGESDTSALSPPGKADTGRTATLQRP